MLKSGPGHSRSGQYTTDTFFFNLVVVLSFTNFARKWLCINFDLLARATEGLMTIFARAFITKMVLVKGSQVQVGQKDMKRECHGLASVHNEVDFVDGEEGCVYTDAGSVVGEVGSVHNKVAFVHDEVGFVEDEAVRRIPDGVLGGSWDFDRREWVGLLPGNEHNWLLDDSESGLWCNLYQHIPSTCAHLLMVQLC